MAISEEEFKQRVLDRAKERGIEATPEAWQWLDDNAGKMVDMLDGFESDIDAWGESKKGSWLGR